MNKIAAHLAHLLRLNMKSLADNHRFATVACHCIRRRDDEQCSDTHEHNSFESAKDAHLNCHSFVASGSKVMVLHH
jgi:hypothetical protein